MSVDTVRPEFDPDEPRELDPNPGKTTEEVTEDLTDDEQSEVRQELDREFGYHVLREE